MNFVWHASFLPLAVLSLAFLVQIFIYSKYFFRLNSENKKRKNSPENSPKTPPVSVILYVKDEGEKLAKNLPKILEQDYPDFEVIVVNDGNEETISAVVARFQTTHKNLYQTYLPENAKVVSRKKMGLTIGIKAAKNDVLLLTNVSSAPISKRWIATMARHFDEKTDVVLGYGGFEKKAGFLNRIIGYDTLFLAMNYFSSAILGEPFMGVWRNLAFRKSAFLRQKSFAQVLNYRFGEDTLLVNLLANSQNTKVEFSCEGQTISEPKHSLRAWIRSKERWLSTFDFLKPKVRSRLILEMVSRVLFYGALAATAIEFLPLSATIAVGLFLVRLSVLFAAVVTSAKALGERHFAGTILLLDFIFPFVYFLIILKKLTLRTSKRKFD